ncbi:hypothetical protein BKA66DRAFT_453323 [Pyrenochaeta sp. MPI-SDFR-AT-0127]|nr:hypothetical protein BKA66DRAFT_453323 [Pyrenochaeta sp. MPI-SDFR-AT-0127]
MSFHARARSTYARLIPVHRGQPQMCGAACHKKQAESGIEYDEKKYVEVVSIEKETVVDETICRLE